MSSYSITFIPEQYSFLPSDEQRIQIEQFAAQYGAHISVDDDIRFADAGSDFVGVTCPYCGDDCLPWWGERMTKASDGMGSFQNIDILLPCCGQKTSLHKLHYKAPQGFYRFKMEIADPIEVVEPAVIARALQDVAGLPWRVIHSHY